MILASNLVELDPDELELIENALWNQDWSHLGPEHNRLYQRIRDIRKQVTRDQET